MASRISECTTRQNLRSSGLQQQKIPFGFHSCLPRTECWVGTASPRLTVQDWQVENHCLGLMNLDVCCDMQMEGSEFANICHPCKWVKFQDGAGGVRPVEHSFSATACLSIVADQVHPFIVTICQSYDGYIQHDNAACHKARVIIVYKGFSQH